MLKADETESGLVKGHCRIVGVLRETGDRNARKTEWEEREEGKEEGIGASE